EEGVLIENIEQALEFRLRSQKEETIQKSFAARLVAALRKAFGGHEVKKKET
ncbi:MAG: 6-phosphogluconate dehydrogenase, partial [Candidatus Levybacteria bacterium]|nr:6-phosphogluconate dehydrogenase [Candidatus Levybacteria bacterium]